MPISNLIPEIDMKNIYKKLGSLAFAAMMLTSCEKEYLDTVPSDKVAAETVFATTEGAFVALDGIYRRMWVYNGRHHDFGQKSHDLTMDLMGNDMVVHSAGYNWFNSEYQYTAITSPATSSRSERAWTYYYTIINNANRILANIDNAKGPDAEKEYLKGNALALRAHSYYYLTNMWQHTYKGNESKPAVPLYTEPTSEGKPRSTVQEVYAQIVKDLDAAEKMLEGKSRRVSPSHINAKVVKGLRARVALQMEDWQTAATKANEARQGFSLMSDNDFKAGFGVDNNEWMWGLDVQNDQSTIYASFFSHVDPTRLSYAMLGTQKKITKALYDQIADNDVRKSVYRTPGTGAGRIPDYTSLKFVLPVSGSWEGDYILMRSAEMYLIEAEALARLNRDAEALVVLNNLLEARYVDAEVANFQPVVAVGQSLINEILLQRRIELWGEGFALIDIKRLKQPLDRPSGDGNHKVSLATIFNIPAEDPAFLFRIPQREIDANDKISASDQNP
jgi:starch-binding outer membrane protein, SusD/RagB family